MMYIPHHPMLPEAQILYAKALAEDDTETILWLLNTHRLGYARARIMFMCNGKQVIFDDGQLPSAKPNVTHTSIYKTAVTAAREECGFQLTDKHVRVSFPGEIMDAGYPSMTFVCDITEEEYQQIQKYVADGLSPFQRVTFAKAKI